MDEGIAVTHSGAPAAEQTWIRLGCEGADYSRFVPAATAWQLRALSGSASSYDRLMGLRLQLADRADAAEIAALRVAVADDLTAAFGKGHWSGRPTDRGVLNVMRTASVYVARRRAKVIATLALSTRKPWSIDKAFFTASKQPLYLTDMAVTPDLQRQGIGRDCLAEAFRIARGWPAEFIRLDAYDADAGAGEFYQKCGYTELGRKDFKGTPLIYFEIKV
jgi:GNAT superfamily N-acetyltransferase